MYSMIIHLVQVVLGYLEVAFQSYLNKYFWLASEIFEILFIILIFVKDKDGAIELTENLVCVECGDGRETDAVSGS